MLPRSSPPRSRCRSTSVRSASGASARLPRRPRLSPPPSSRPRSSFPTPVAEVDGNAVRRGSLGARACSRARRGRARRPGGARRSRRGRARRGSGSRGRGDGSGSASQPLSLPRRTSPSPARSCRPSRTSRLCRSPSQRRAAEADGPAGHRRGAGRGGTRSRGALRLTERVGHQEEGRSARFRARGQVAQGRRPEDRRVADRCVRRRRDGRRVRAPRARPAAARRGHRRRRRSA